ncbi:hypothetical protein NDU88_003536 [Pleurodeles waltl]|uniref:Uncharacterized protein n=1 Tax=Pleurodeles waltl TaxID=8319 RepID=A0AAV7TQ05_PLEWA|nr:hypothetical protein NDU88_003536 [Pleurodeles waltl]
MGAINSTRDGLNTKEKLRTLRLMVLQHRYVWDILTAMEGGVCRKIGSLCYTFVSANDAEKGSITNAIEDFNNIGNKMFDEGGAKADIFTNWFDFSWMPSWVSAILKMIVLVCGVLLLLCCAIQMIFHCVKKAGAKVECMNYAGTKQRNRDAEDTALLDIVELTVIIMHTLQPRTVTENETTSPRLPPGRFQSQEDPSVSVQPPKSALYSSLTDMSEGEYVELGDRLHSYTNDTPWMPQQDQGPAKYTERDC